MHPVDPWYVIASGREGLCTRRAQHKVAGLGLCTQHKDMVMQRLYISIITEPVMQRLAGDALAHSLTNEDESLLRPDPGDTTVYFAKRHQFVKIGYAANLKKRLTDIGNGSGIIPGMSAGPVRLLAAIPGGPVKERKLHRRFRHIRVGGEWFLLNDEMQVFIYRIRQSQKEAA